MEQAMTMHLHIFNLILYFIMHSFLFFLRGREKKRKDINNIIHTEADCELK